MSSPLEQSYCPSRLVDPEPSPVDRYLTQEQESRERVVGVAAWRAKNRVPAVFEQAFRDEKLGAW